MSIPACRWSGLSRYIRTVLLLFLVVDSEPAAASGVGIQAPDLEVARQELILRLSQRLPRAEMEAIFSDPRLELDRSVIPPKRYRPATRYYRTILTPASIRAGKSYLERYASLLSDAQRKYGVPPEVIAGILRIETDFGRSIGRRRVINTLYSLYVLVPKRKTYALRELGAFISLCRRNHWDPYQIVGSPMGAFGFPQFLPSSYLSYAVDGDRDGTPDLFSSADAIHSTAAYLREFGWGDSRSSQFRAIFAYNHEKEYVKTVLAYADRLRRANTPPQPLPATDTERRDRDVRHQQDPGEALLR